MNWKRSCVSFAVICLGMVVLSSLLPIVSSYNAPSSTNAAPSTTPQASIASGKVKIATSDQNPLGQIYLTYLNFLPKGLYSLQDLNDLKATHVGFPAVQLVGTVTPASLDTKSPSGLGSVYNMTIRLKETVNWTYNENITSKLIGFRPYLSPISMNAMYLNDTLVPSNKYFVNSSSFSYDQSFFGDVQERQNIYYDFTTEFQTHPNGTLILSYQYDYNLPISSWECNNIGSIQYLRNYQQNIIQSYINNITIGTPTRILNLTGTFNITLPDRMEIYETEFTNLDGHYPSEVYEYDREMNSFSIPQINLTSTRQFDFTFKGNFTVEIIDTVADFWAEDRLVESQNLRERDYKITVSAGPASLKIKNLLINETSIYYKDVAGSNQISSALGRTVFVNNMNVSTGAPSSFNMTYYDGIILLGKATESLYYLVKGEVDVVTVRYTASRTLTAIITDKITNPLAGYKVRVYFGNQSYGSQISLGNSKPYPELITNSRGQITIPYAPIANFTLVISDGSGNFVCNESAHTLVASNLIITPVVHFPSVILIYTGIFTAVLLLGIAIYKKNSNQ